jgi:hypothetical protein
MKTYIYSGCLWGKTALIMDTKLNDMHKIFAWIEKHMELLAMLSTWMKENLEHFTRLLSHGGHSRMSKI